MRYQNFKSFEKHLASAAPHHLCRLYLVIAGDDWERSKILQSLLRSAPGGYRADSLDALESPSLFGGEPLVVLDGVEKFGKKEAQALSDRMERGLSFGYLFLGASSKTSLSAAVEKEGVVLDLSEEKVWEREKRLAEQLMDRMASAGKRLAPDVPPLLFERLGMDAALLDQEIDKLLCFAADRPTVERADVFRISAANRNSTLWQVAEEIVWERKGELLDGDLFFGLMPALRFQLQLGLKIASLMEEGIPSEKWASYLPRIWPRTLEKRREQVAQLGTSYFAKGLDFLFRVELLSRTGSNQTGALLDLFRASL